MKTLRNKTNNNKQTRSKHQYELFKLLLSIQSKQSILFTSNRYGTAGSSPTNAIIPHASTTAFLNCSTVKVNPAIATDKANKGLYQELSVDSVVDCCCELFVDSIGCAVAVEIDLSCGLKVVDGLKDKLSLTDDNEPNKQTKMKKLTDKLLTLLWADFIEQHLHCQTTGDTNSSYSWPPVDQHSWAIEH